MGDGDDRERWWQKRTMECEKIEKEMWLMPSDRDDGQTSTSHHEKHMHRLLIKTKVTKSIILIALLTIT
jgi:hypothetical protein